jgi:hypothetical protein
MVKTLSNVYYEHIAPSVRNIICMQKLSGGALVDLTPHYAYFEQNLSEKDRLKAVAILNYLMLTTEVDCTYDKSVGGFHIPNPKVAQKKSFISLDAKVALTMLKKHLHLNA